MSSVDRPELRGPVTRWSVTHVSGGGATTRRERVATEEPLEIRCGGPAQTAERVAVTMRTPGHDFELAAGFLRAEGLLVSHEEIESIRYCEEVEDESQQFNVVTVRLRRAFDAGALTRSFVTTSACGVCGLASIEQVRSRIDVAAVAVAVPAVVGAEVIESLPATLRDRQSVFDRTGGLHAAAVFDARGRLVVLREDVGRHNAVDKVIGHAFLRGALPLERHVLMVSGRASFEILQKALAARIPVVAAVSAPSSLAVEFARRSGQTLVGFLRDDRMNVYSHPGRIVFDAC